MFHEVNHARTTQLDKASMTPQTIVNIIRDETQSPASIIPCSVRFIRPPCNTHQSSKALGGAW